jgi:uncharacterized membrane protein
LGLVLLTGALAVSAYLAWHSWTGTVVPGCSEGAGCDEVLSGRWGQVSGLPVSVPGAFVYAVAIGFGVASLGAARDRWRRWRVALAVLVAGAALWFTLLQALVIGAFCPWCLAAHALGVTGAVLLVGQRRPAAAGSQVVPAPRGWWVRAEVVAPLAAVVAMAVIQANVRPPERVVEAEIAGTHPASQTRTVEALLGNDAGFAASELPLIGDAGAETVGLVLTDYTCPHCRALHRTLEQVTGESPQPVAFALVPAYRDEAAAEVHRVLLTAWRADPAFTGDLIHELVAGAAEAEPARLRARVDEHFGGRFFERAWDHAGWTASVLQAGQRLMAANDATLAVSTLPQLMVGGRMVAGEPGTDTVHAMVAAAAASPSASPGGERATFDPRLAATDRAEPATPPGVPPPAPAPPPAPPPARAQIEFAEPALRLPEVVQGQIAEGRFTFRNTGTAPLTLTNIKTSCGCTAVEGWRQTVPPGGEGSFAVKLDTKRLSGRVTKMIDVTSNAANPPGGVAKVSVTADVWLPVQLSANSANFGTALAGAEIPPKQITVTVTDPQPLEIGPPASSNPYFQATMETLEQGRRYLITVTIPEPRAGTEQGELVLHLGHPRMEKLAIPLYARVAPPVEVIPGEVVLAKTVAGAAQQRFVTVYCHDRSLAGFEVTGVSVSGVEGVTAVAEPATQPHVSWRRVRLTIPPGFDPMAAAPGARLTIQTNHPGYPEVHAAIRGFFPQAPSGARSQGPG